jgi:hypothetical protein
MDAPGAKSKNDAYIGSKCGNHKIQKIHAGVSVEVVHGIYDML